LPTGRIRLPTGRSQLPKGRIQLPKPVSELMSLVMTKPLHSLLRNNSCIVNSKWPINCLHPGKFNKLQGSPNTIRISTDDCKIFDTTLTIGMSAM